MTREDAMAGGDDRGRIELPPRCRAAVVVGAENWA